MPVPRLHLFLMLALTFTTGINDAVGYLGLDKVFTGNMTGNVVVLGMALAGGSNLPVLGPALALAGFAAGAAAGGRALANDLRPWGPRTTALFTFVGVVMLGLGTALALTARSHPVDVLITTVAAIAMGLQAATARHVAVKEVTTVVVTSAITGLAADSWFGNGTGGLWRRRAGAVALILLGALAGAAMLQWHLAVPMFVAGALILLSTAAGARAD